jgi:hypothetical protein
MVYTTPEEKRMKEPYKYKDPIWIGCLNYHAKMKCRCTYTIAKLTHLLDTVKLDYRRR